MPLTNQNTEQLLLLCLAGNQRAQLEIYNRYYKAMYNSAIRIVNDPYKAEDIMQESFLTAFTKLNSLKDKNTFGAWLKRIVINNSIQDYNKNSKHNEVALDNVLYKVEDESGIESSSLEHDKIKHVMRTIESLKENYKVAITLHLIEGYDYEEIGEIMNISYANCRTLVSRAKESLRKKLQPMAEI